jgi:hypothetical protein
VGWLQGAAFWALLPLLLLLCLPLLLLLLSCLCEPAPTAAHTLYNKGLMR